MANHKSAEKRARQSEARRREVEAAMRRASAKRLIPKRRASRRISRMAKALNKATPR